MDARIKILFVEYCPNLKGGGAQRVFLNVLQSIDCTKFRVYAAFPDSDGSELAAEVPSYVTKFDYDSRSPEGNKNRLLAYFLFALFVPAIVLRWCYIIKRQNIDVVYVHSIISGFHFGIVKYLLGYKLIYHEHNMASQRPHRALWRWMFNFVVCRSDKIVAISRSVAGSLVDYGVENGKVAVIYNGIELKNISETLRAEGMRRLSIAGHSNTLLVGMVGHFRPWKGQKLFVESLPSALESGVDLHYVLIGGVQDESYHQQVLDYVDENDFAGRVTLTGHQDKILELMVCLDIAVVPSVPEPFGLVLLEAMLASKPIIAFDIGGPKEIVIDNETGTLVGKIDSRALGLAIGRLALDVGARERMGSAGRSLLEQKFTIQQQCRQIEKLIEGLFQDVGYPS